MTKKKKKINNLIFKLIIVMLYVGISMLGIHEALMAITSVLAVGVFVNEK